MTNPINDNEYKGFSLFNDIEDAELRNRNRVVILKNIAISHTKNRKITPGGAALMLGYFARIPDEERLAIQLQLIEHMKKEGMYVVTNKPN